MGGALAHAAAPRRATPHAPIAFLDRDGVLNLSLEGHISDPDELRLVPGAASCIARLRHAGMVICIVTNQSGVDRGWTSEAKIHAIHDRLVDLLLAEDPHARVDLTLTCPHTPWHGCTCIKPESGLLRLGEHLIRGVGWTAALRARLPVPKNGAVGQQWKDIMVGDRRSDVLAGHAHGARSFHASPDVGLQPLLSRLLDHDDLGDAVR